MGTLLRSLLAQKGGPFYNPFALLMYCTQETETFNSYLYRIILSDGGMEQTRHILNIAFGLELFWQSEDI